LPQIKQKNGHHRGLIKHLFLHGYGFIPFVAIISLAGPFMGSAKKSLSIQDELLAILVKSLTFRF
jgi:hypothetical protein